MDSLSKSFCVSLVFLLALVVVGRQDFEEQKRQEVEYCHMVKLNRQSNGQIGWPDFEERGCK